jgi:anaerobic ribonucleoside-triphosphate reductase activating protein
MDTWDFEYGNPFTEIEMNEVIEACKKSYIAGLTILGGEPFEPENQQDLLPLITRFSRELPGKNLWMYTGYVLERDLLPGQRKNVPVVTDRILDAVDTLVDGPFILEQRDLGLKFRGSRNQRVLDRKAIADFRN